MSKEKEIKKQKEEEMNCKKNWEDKQNKKFREIDDYDDYVASVINDVDYQKYKENKNKETLNLLNKIGTWGMRLSENEDAWIYDIGLIQNYAWELNESYKKLSKHLDVENLIS